MSDRLQYITLISSLPHIGRLFSEHGTGISRYRLDERLTLLESEHARLLDRVVSITAWSSVSKIDTDAEVIALARSVIGDLDLYPDIQNLVRSRMETRTLIAALRRRREGAREAGDISAWGFGRWCRSIRDNWSDPGFGLSQIMPWVAEADRLMKAGDHVAVERLVLTDVFRQIGRHSAGHEFDFTAVVAYVLRWIIVERWSVYGTAKAAERLRSLLADALKSAPPPFAVVPDPESALQQEVHP
ncbi:hypothetical protein H2509_10530 [Stappia sp. F7233]|uniref:DUF2764 family protein n=1 Tax=Stappia albiluteola TaxID=2758565 RepID=A0A839AFJ4_9HYPH|nr:hypothetical protein [Stappia albiluteola]MBA5777557.1 hypothetical protein [Stappia albiluteola]